MYLKSFEVRWNDLDANRHLANSAYVNFMSHTRMSCFYEHGITQEALVRNHLGPVVFYEHIHYFREVLPEQKVRVSLEVSGLSADGRFFEFQHNFYDETGRNLACCEVMGGWIDLNKRSLASLPKEILEKLQGLDRTEGFRVLTRQDTRRHVRHPKPLA